MSRCKRFIAAVPIALLSAGFSFAHGAEPEIAPTPEQQQLYLDAGVTTAPSAAPVPATAASRRPLMTLLDQAGVGGWLTRNRINVFGWVEGSFNHNFDNPRSSLNVGHLFDIQDNDVLVNQLQVNVERTVVLSPNQFDFGGRIDYLYGSDARFIHSNGMFDDVGYPNGPQYQFDIPQLYVDLALPVGDGLRLRVGKFEFFKLTDPNASPLFSHTFFYDTGGEAGSAPRIISTGRGAALPFTLTGVTGYYEFGKQLSAEAGIGRGFDQSLSDDNGAIDAFGRVNYKFSTQTQVSFALITGPEIAGDNSHYRTVGDLSVSQSITNDFGLLFDAVYGLQARPTTLDGISIGSDAHWYGLNATGVYRVNRNVSVAARLEWYRDEQGFTTGFGRGVNLYEATAGVTITPFPDSQWGSGLKIRPELRYDYSDQRFFATEFGHHQWIAAVDAIYNF